MSPVPSTAACNGTMATGSTRLSIRCTQSLKRSPSAAGPGRRLNQALLEVTGGLVGLGAGDALGAGLLETAEMVGVGLFGAAEGDGVACGDAAVHALTATSNTAPAIAPPRWWVVSPGIKVRYTISWASRPDCGETTSRRDARLQGTISTTPLSLSGYTRPSLSGYSADFGLSRPMRCSPSVGGGA